MAYTTLTSLFTAIADAIREKCGTTDKINAQDFPTKILEINNNTGETSIIATMDSNNVVSIDGLNAGQYSLYYEDASGNKLNGYEKLTGSSEEYSMEAQ